MTPELSIIVLCANTRELVVPCLESIQRHAPSTALEVILVDNASSDGTEDAVRSRFPAVRIIRNEENIGFARANNEALRVCRGEFALLLNDDTLILEGTLDELLGVMRRHPRAGIVGCRHVNGEGATQPAAGALPGYMTQVASFYGLRRLLSARTATRLSAAPGLGKLVRRLTQGYFIPFERNEETKRVGFISGACMLVRRELWEEIGLLDEEIFIYLEDVDWCRRAADAGWELYYVPTATIVHYGGQSSMKTSSGRTYHISERRIRSLMYYARKHDGRSGVLAAKAIVVPALIGRLGIAAARAVADRRRGSADPSHLLKVLRASLGA